MKLFNFTIIKLTICLIIGIIIGYFINIPLSLIFYILGVGLLIFSVNFFIAKKQFIPTVWFGVMAYTLTIIIGVFIVNIHNQKNHSTHYCNAPACWPSARGLDKTNGHKACLVHCSKANYPW